MVPLINVFKLSIFLLVIGLMLKSISSIFIIICIPSFLFVVTIITIFIYNYFVYDIFEYDDFYQNKTIIRVINGFSLLFTLILIITNIEIVCLDHNGYLFNLISSWDLNQHFEFRFVILLIINLIALAIHSYIVQQLNLYNHKLILSILLILILLASFIYPTIVSINSYIDYQSQEYIHYEDKQKMIAEEDMDVYCSYDFITKDNVFPILSPIKVAIGKINKGDDIIILDYSDNYVHVTNHKITGYVKMEYFN